MAHRRVGAKRQKCPPAVFRAEADLRAEARASGAAPSTAIEHVQRFGAKQQKCPPAVFRAEADLRAEARARAAPSTAIEHVQRFGAKRQNKQSAGGPVAACI